MAFYRGADGQAVSLLQPVRLDLWRIGGSNAQRDVVDWTLTEAAVRGGVRDVALSLANKRLGMARAVQSIGISKRAPRRSLHDDQPLIAPNASPRARCRCSAIMNATIGSMMPTAAAAESDQ